MCQEKVKPVGPKPNVPINTLDKALELARALSRDLASEESKAIRSSRIFIALAANEQEGLAAYLIWRARGEVISELAAGR